jgi:hypothetical protein
MNIMPSKAKYQVSVILPEKLHKDLIRIARLKQKTVAKILPKVIENYIAEEDCATEELAKRQRPVAETLMPHARVQDLGLSRAEVDPDFQGTSTEFLEKYGHVNLKSKAQLERDAAVARVDALVAGMKKFIAAEDAGISVEDIKLWIKADPTYRRDKFTKRALKFHDMVERLQPILEDFLTS